MINKPRPFRGLKIWAPIINPVKGRGVHKSGVWVRMKKAVKRSTTFEGLGFSATLKFADTGHWQTPIHACVELFI